MAAEILNGGGSNGSGFNGYSDDFRGSKYGGGASRERRERSQRRERPERYNKNNGGGGNATTGASSTGPSPVPPTAHGPNKQGSNNTHHAMPSPTSSALVSPTPSSQSTHQEGDSTAGDGTHTRRGPTPTSNSPGAVPMGAGSNVVPSTNFHQPQHPGSSSAGVPLHALPSSHISGYNGAFKPRTGPRDGISRGRGPPRGNGLPPRGTHRSVGSNRIMPITPNDSNISGNTGAPLMNNVPLMPLEAIPNNPGAPTSGDSTNIAPASEAYGLVAGSAIPSENFYAPASAAPAGYYAVPAPLDYAGGQLDAAGQLVVPQAVGSASGAPLVGANGYAYYPTTGAVPYIAPNYTTDPERVKELLRAQIEYYFSEENLQGDFFLRRKMDDQGFLPISLIASFHRVQALTQDVSLVVESLANSSTVEVVDGVKMRTRFDPTKWPLVNLLNCVCMSFLIVYFRLFIRIT